MKVYYRNQIDTWDGNQKFYFRIKSLKSKVDYAYKFKLGMDFWSELLVTKNTLIEINILSFKNMSQFQNCQKT